MESYLEIPELAKLVLEESYVLGVEEGDGTIEIRLDAVLARDHPELRPPRPGEWAYIREAVIRFTSVSEFSWTARMPPATDATGSASWDGFESVTRDGNLYRLAGDVGNLTFRAERIEFVWIQEP